MDLPPTDREIRSLTDQVRRTDAVVSRRREQWLRRQAEEEGTFHGMLADLAERRVAVAFHTRAHRVLRGATATLGADFVAIGVVSGHTTVIPLAVVTSVRPEPGTPPTVGDRAVTTSGTLAGSLADLGADRPRAALHTVGGDRVTGRVWTVGRDFLVVRCDRGPESYVPFTAVNDFTVW